MAMINSLVSKRRLRLREVVKFAQDHRGGAEPGLTSQPDHTAHFRAAIQTLLKGKAKEMNLC